MDFKRNAHHQNFFGAWLLVHSLKIEQEEFI
jgi:hypothetical protein